MKLDFDKGASMQRCLRHRRRVLEISQKVSALHVAGCFSCLEIVDTIYSGFMNIPGVNPSDNVFIMSKGHGALSQYVVLEGLGVLSGEDLDSYCKPEGRLGCHPDRGTPGIIASTGSLGHGMALSVGVAYADKYVHETEAVCFVLLSDGEMQEGSTWEAMMMAANLRLPNLVAIVDHNGFQSFGRTLETHPSFYPIIDKISSFGWDTCEINGHDSLQIFNALQSRDHNRPLMVVANTTKGKGVSYMENSPIWHYRSPTSEEYHDALHALVEIKE